MGYLKIDTESTGEVVINAANVLYVKKTGQAIDLVINLGPNPEKTEIRISGANITENTKQKFNEAVINAQVQAFVVVRPSGDEEFTSVSLDPS